MLMVKCSNKKNGWPDVPFMEGLKSILRSVCPLCLFVTLIFHEFPGLENGLTKFHDFHRLENTL